MFDRFTASNKNRRGGARMLAIASIVLHLFLGALLVAMGFWEISELGRPNRGVAMATTTMSASGGAAEKPAGKKVERTKRRVHDTRQPDQRPQEEIKSGGSAVSATGTEGELGDPNATGDGPPGGPGSVGDLCLNADGCGGPEPGTPKVIEPPAKPRLLPPTVLSELQRIAGDPQIQPPTSTKNAMSQANQERAVAVVKMCLDRQGAVSSLALVKSSGYAEYDAKLLSKIRRWRYRPYRADGLAIAICTHVTFIYQQE